jgi:ABC transporter transmembrane region 2
MANRSSKPSDSIATAAAPLAGARLSPQMLMMFRAFWASPQRAKILLLGVALFAVIGATAFGQIRLNAWNRPFYDALARKDLGELRVQLMVFGIIASGLLVLNVMQAWLNQKAKVKLREGLVRDLFDEWLKPRRAFRLLNAGEMGVNPDQRIHEDARHLSELSGDLCIGLLQSSAPLGQLHRCAMDPLRKRDLPFERARLRHSWLHGLVRPSLCGHRFLAQLAHRPTAIRAQFGALRPGGRSALRARAPQRAY